MKVKLPSWFKRNPRTVLLTGEDIINLKSDLDHLQTIFEKVFGETLVTLRDDVNSALSGTAKAIYKLEALEERMVAAEEKVKYHLGDGKTSH